MKPQPQDPLPVYLMAGQRHDLDVTITGLRPNDPVLRKLISKEEEIRVISPLFELVESRVTAVNEQGNEYLHAVLKVRTSRTLSLRDRTAAVEISLGENIQLHKGLSFRTIGDTWSEEGAVNLGEIRKKISQKVVLRFRPGVELWESVRIGSVDPPEWREAIEIKGLEKRNDSLLIEMSLDPDKAPRSIENGDPTSVTLARSQDPFFHFSLVFKTGEGESTQEVETAFYGMIPF